MKTSTALALLAGLCLAAVTARGDDWPQWRGPDRDGVSKEKGLTKTWPKDGPPLVWTMKELGLGYSGPAVVGDRLYILGTRGDGECLFALDVKSGKEVWQAPAKIGPVFTFKGNSWGNGPRATAAVAAGMVYALGGFGDLVCVDAKDGKEVWRRSMAKDFGGAVNPIMNDAGGWGWTWSPLVDGDQVIAVPGGKDGLLAALDKKTGNVIWRSTGVTDKATYSSPIVAEVGGIRQYVAMTNAGVVGVAAKDGKPLWYYKRTPEYKDVVIPTPVFHDDAVYVTITSLAFKGGCDLVKLTPDGGGITATKAWANLDLPNTVAGVVRVGEHVYGYSESKENQGWVCQEFKTGKLVWPRPGDFEPGSAIAADGCLYCYGEETGTLVLAEASPAGWKEKARFEIPQKSAHRPPNGKIWTPPVLADGKLYLRDEELLFCYDVK
jgi:outer membrane protein assembly factor BamB